MEAMGVAATQQGTVDREKVLPLPGWLVKVYFIFPVILYIPDAIFNYYVYSDGWNTDQASPLLQAGKVALVSFLSIGVVGMAYLLSVLRVALGTGTPHPGVLLRPRRCHCDRYHHLEQPGLSQEQFVEFKTDQWVYNIWPQLPRRTCVSITMILVFDCPAVLGTLLGDGAADDLGPQSCASCRSRTPRR